MRDTRRIGPLLHRLGALWRKHPDLRLGQLMMNLAQQGVSKDLFYIEDEDLAGRIEEAMTDWDWMKENGGDDVHGPQ